MFVIQDRLHSVCNNLNCNREVELCIILLNCFDVPIIYYSVVIIC